MGIQTEIDRLTAAKAALRTAIEAKGVTVPNTATLDAYPNALLSIPVIVWDEAGQPYYVSEVDEE